MNDRQDPSPPDDWPGDPHAPSDPYAGYRPNDPYPADPAYPPYQQGGYQQPQPDGYGYDAYGGQQGQGGQPQQGYPQGGRHGVPPPFPQQTSPYPQQDQTGYAPQPAPGQGGYDPYGPGAAQSGLPYAPGQQGGGPQPGTYDTQGYPHQGHQQGPPAVSSGPGGPGRDGAFPGGYSPAPAQGYQPPQHHAGHQGQDFGQHGGPGAPYGAGAPATGAQPAAVRPYAPGPGGDPVQPGAFPQPRQDGYAAAEPTVPRTSTRRRVPRQATPEQAPAGPAGTGQGGAGQGGVGQGGVGPVGSGPLASGSAASGPAGAGPAGAAQPVPGQPRSRRAQRGQQPQATAPDGGRPAGRRAEPPQAGDQQAGTGQRRAGQQQPVPADGARAGDAAADAPGEDYRTEQFSFIEEQDEESEDVIDWLKFAETRSERRDGRKRQLRTRLIAGGAALALVVGGGVGYLWYAEKLPGMSSSSDDSASAGGAQRRQVIVVHLRETKGGGSSSILLVDNATTKKGSTVLLPNALAVPGENGTTTLGNAVESEGAGGTRDALSALLGSDIQGTWRLDTPYLENLVELVGGITVDTDVLVPGAKEGDDPLVKRGKGTQLTGQGAVAYATHREPSEDQNKQLGRFGQVMRAVLDKISTDPGKATSTVEQLAQIPDPSLSEKQLGASLAGLAQRADDGSYATELLAVQPDGTLSDAASENVVKDVLGGSVKQPEDGASSAPRVSVRNATGDEAKAGSAQVALVNGGFTVVAGGTAGTESTSRVTYADAAHADQAKQVAATLGLPASAVAQGKGAANADVTVVLGSDFGGRSG